MLGKSKNTENSTNKKSSTSLVEKKENPAPVIKKGKTRITIIYDTGYSNELYIRGKGANLSWEQGQLLKNIGHDEWIYETNVPFT